MNSINVVAIVVLIFGALLLLFFPGKPGGTISIGGFKISSTGPGLPVMGLAVVLFILGNFKSPSKDSKPEKPVPSTSGANSLTFSFDFDGGIVTAAESANVFDGAGRRRGSLSKDGLDKVKLIEHPGKGKGIKFVPPPCPAAKNCPTAFITLDDTVDLNPGTRDFSYGVDVLLEPGDRPANDTVQKGEAARGQSQWRVEITADRKARCLLIPTKSTKYDLPYDVISPEPLSDGEWHTLRCTKIKDTLTVQVDDDNSSKRDKLGSEFAVSNGRPLRIGGTTTLTGTEPFSGAIDNVFFQIDS